MIPNFKKSFLLVCRACRVESIDISYIALGLIFTRYEYFSVFGQLFENEIQIWKKAFHKFVELVETNLLIYNTLHVDQFSLFV